MDQFVENSIGRFIDDYKYDYRDYFKKCISPCFTSLYYDNNDTDSITYLEKLADSQKQLHHLYYIELKKLFNYAKNNNINIIGFKGIFLEESLYKSSECIRFYDDIDLLICNKDRKKIAEYFKKYTNFKIIDDKASIFKLYYKLFKSNAGNIGKINIDNLNHIVLQEKKQNFYLTLELHSNLNFLNLSKFDHIQIFEDKKQIFINNNLFYTMGEMDHLLFLCHHMIRHLPYVYEECLGPLHIDIKKVIDILLLVKKYNLLYCKDELINRCERYDIVPYVALSFYIVNGLFPNTIDTGIMNTLIKVSREKEYSWKYIFDGLITLKPIDILTGKIEKAFPEIVGCVERIEKLGPFEEYTHFRNIKMFVWKKVLKKLKQNDK